MSSSRPAAPAHTAQDLLAADASGHAYEINDTVRKLRALHRAKVPHYWLVDPERLTLTVLRWTADGYLSVLVAAAPESVRAEPFETIELSLATLFDQTA